MLQVASVRPGPASLVIHKFMMFVPEWHNVLEGNDYLHGAEVASWACQPPPSSINWSLMVGGAGE